MSLNLVLSYESSALAAPQSFRDGMQTAANILDSLILNNITVTIRVGYGDWNNNADTGLTTGAEGGDLYGLNASYTNLRAALASHETSTNDQTFVNSLPSTSSLNGTSTFFVPSAVGKALGLLSPTNPTVDGAVGLGAQIPSNLLVGVALHELTHAMGRVPGEGPFDLFRYTSPGVHLFSSSNTAPAAYFSIDGGNTKLADFGQSSDPSDFLNSGVQGFNDAFNEFYSSNTFQSLTAVDKELLDVLGFNVSAQTNHAPSANADNYSVTENSTLTVSGPGVLGNDTDADGNALTAVLASKPSHGTLTLNADGSFNFAPDANFLGTDSFTYYANDGAVNSTNPATVSITVNADTAKDAIWSMNGLSSSGGDTSQKLGPDWHIVLTGDFNGDKNADILWRNDNSHTGIWFMNGTQVSGGDTSQQLGPDWHVVGTGDFNGDGKTDILWRNNNSHVGIWSMNGTQVVSAGDTSQQLGPDWHVVGAGDFNGDGKSDILWRNNSGHIGIWTMNGTQVASASDTSQQLGLDWHIVGTGDFNGDGKTDILWRNDNGHVGVWTMNGTQVVSASDTSQQLGPDWHIIGTGDFNGDAKADVLWRNDNGNIGIWFMNGTHVDSGGNTTQQVGPDWRVVATGDFNGDGKTDLVFRDDGTSGHFGVAWNSFTQHYDIV